MRRSDSAGCYYEGGIISTDIGNRIPSENMDTRPVNVKGNHDGGHYIPGTGSLGRLTHKYIETNSDEELHNCGQVKSIDINGSDMEKDFSN